MPKSVKNMLNTKVQRCGRHQVNPVSGLDEGEKDGKTTRMAAGSGWGQEVVGGKKWLSMSLMRSMSNCKVQGY
jgi:hypothetical protein